MKKSTELFMKTEESREKFDYFVCGTAAALFAYAGQNYQSSLIRWDASLFEPIALLLLVLSFIAGLKRLEFIEGLRRLNVEYLDLGERAGEMTSALSPENIGKKSYNTGSGEFYDTQTLIQKRAKYMSDAAACERILESRSGRAKTLYQIRNGLLVAGFIALLAAKIAKPYV